MTGPSQIARLPAGASSAAIWAHVPGANGHAIDGDEHWVMASVGAFVRLDGGGRITRVDATHVGGSALIYPNGVALDRHRGGAYATDSGYSATPRRIDGPGRGRVCRIEPDDAVRVVADGLAYANGVALSADGARLLVGESTARRIWSYAIEADGGLGARRLFAELPPGPEGSVPDGITVARDGRVYVAWYGARTVLRYDPDGRLAARLPAGNRCASHVALDRDERVAYVSGGIEDEQGAGAIFAIDR